MFFLILKFWLFKSNNPIFQICGDRMSFRPSVEMLDFQFRATVERKKRKFGELRRLRTMYKQRGKFYLHNRMMRRGGRRQRSVNIDLEDENANYYMSDRHENCFLSRLNATKQFLMKLKENWRGSFYENLWCNKTIFIDLTNRLQRHTLNSKEIEFLI